MIVVLADVGLTQSAIAKVMEADRLLSSQASVDLLPGGATVMAQLGETATPERPSESQL